jgi:hypothetical protein
MLIRLNNIYDNSDLTAKKTQHFTVTKISWLTLFKEIIAVHCENRTKHANTFCGQNAELLIVKARGTYSHYRDYIALLNPKLKTCNFRQLTAEAVYETVTHHTV